MPNHRLIFAAAVALLLLAALHSRPSSAQEARVDPVDRELGARQAAFFKSLMDGELQKAYARIVKGGLLASQEKAVDGLRLKTRQAITLYQGPVSVENLGVVFHTRQLAYGQVILCCKKGPLFFYFTWYRAAPTAPWQVININFNDATRQFITHWRKR